MKTYKIHKTQNIIRGMEKKEERKIDRMKERLERKR
jgi:hypothetical protein